MIRLLLDGWALIHAANRSAAMHLWALLQLKSPDLSIDLALPGEPRYALPGNARVQVSPCPNTPAGRLRWEQRQLPKLSRLLASQVVHVVGGYPALVGTPASVISPAGFSSTLTGEPALPARPTLSQRLREALGQGGAARAKAIAWPDDLPAPNLPGKLARIPPLTPLTFPNPPRDAAPELPEAYFLYHGPLAKPALASLLGAWSWAASALGEQASLLILGLDEIHHSVFQAMLVEYGLEGKAHALPELPPEQIVQVYGNCQALFHPAQISPWGDPVRLALACGKPVAALETPLSDALVGPAGYLVPGDPQDPAVQRSLGAALITIFVEEEIAGALAAAARQRAAGWRGELFSAGMLKVYAGSLSSGG
jgi:glycosyltransferase involved in cell wall biosynthesis